MACGGKKSKGGKSKRQFVKDFNSVPITSIGDNKTLV